MTVQESNHLSAGAGFIGTVSGSTGIGGDALLVGPQNSLHIVGIGSHIGEDTGVADSFGRTGRTPQEDIAVRLNGQKKYTPLRARC